MHRGFSGSQVIPLKFSIKMYRHPFFFRMAISVLILVLYELQEQFGISVSTPTTHVVETRSGNSASTSSSEETTGTASSDRQSTAIISGIASHQANSGLEPHSPVHGEPVEPWAIPLMIEL